MTSMIMGSVGSYHEINGFDKDLFLLYRFTYLAHLCVVLSQYNGIDLKTRKMEINN